MFLASNGQRSHPRWFPPDTLVAAVKAAHFPDLPNESRVRLIHGGRELPDAAPLGQVVRHVGSGPVVLHAVVSAATPSSGGGGGGYNFNAGGGGGGGGGTGAYPTVSVTPKNVVMVQVAMGVAFFSFFWHLYITDSAGIWFSGLSTALLSVFTVLFGYWAASSLSAPPPRPTISGGVLRR